MNQFTTYTIKSKQQGYVWRFKYGLNGNFVSFEMLSGELNAKQTRWLFGGHDEKQKFHEARFPVVELTIKVWKDILKDNFEIIVGEPDLSFEAFWNLYDYKVDKWQAQKAFKKLKEPDIILLFLSIPEYKKFVQRKGVAMKYPGTYINQRSFLDDYKNL